jgi:hypothetical protein
VSNRDGYGGRVMTARGCRTTRSVLASEEINEPRWYWVGWLLKRAGTGLPQIHSAAVSGKEWLSLVAFSMCSQQAIKDVYAES